MKKQSTDTDGPTGRFDFSFTGTKQINLNLDPGEYRGQSVPQITESILKTLREIDSSVSYFNEDAELAAIALNSANDAPSFDIED